MQERDLGSGHHIPAAIAWGRVGSMQTLLLAPMGGKT